jgi:hypothetical protein
VVVVVTGAELCSVLCCVQGSEGSRKQEQRKEKRERKRKRGRGKEKEGGGRSCVGGIRGEVARVRRDA